MVKRASQTDPQYQAPAYHQPFKPREPWHGPTEYGKRMSKELLARARAFTNKKPDKSWAKRVLDRHAGGEEIPQHFLAMALQVAGDGPAPRVPEEREPGSDDA